MKRIYALCDPDTGEERYVGYSQQSLVEVLREHTSVAYLYRRYREKQYYSRATSWINDLHTQGKQPTITLLEEVLPQDANDRKIYWIGQFPNLLNRRNNDTKET